MRKILSICILLLLSFPHLSLAQVPANDNCSGAQFVYLDATGNNCFSSSNNFASSDGISNSCDAGAVLPLPPGGHEVWFTYVASGPVNTITVSPTAAGGAQTVSLTVTNGNCAVGGTNVCNTASSLTNPASVAFATAQGTQVWFSVTSLNADGNFLVCISSVTGYLAPGTSCATAVPICNTLDFSSPGSVAGGAAPTPSCFNSPTVNAFWYKFTPGTTGPIEWAAFPNNVGGFRWALYDISAGCPGLEVSCNSVYDPLQPFGMSTSVVNCTSSPYCPALNVTAGKTYALMVDDTSNTGSGFDFSWGTGIKMLPTAEFTVDSITACGSLTLNLTNTSTSNASTIWVLDYGDGSTNATGNGTNINTLPSHTYTAGVYLVKLTLSQPGGCSNTYSVQITVNPKPAATFTISTNNLCYDGTNPVSSDFSATYNSATATYTWNYPGNTGILGTGINSNTVYWNSTGAIPVTLTITENGCTSNLYRDTLHIYQVPTSTFSLPDSGCTGTTIHVTYSGSAAATATYAWTYGGGTVTNSTNQSFDVSWATPGKYGLSLAVQEHGCLSFPTNDSISIFATPVISVLAPVRVCQDDTLTISPLTNGAATNIYTWNFGSSVYISGNQLNGTTGTFTWPTVGATYWKGFAVSPEGCKSNTDSVAFTVYQKPTANFTISNHQVCGSDSTTVTYNGNALPSATYSWNFSTSTILSGSGKGPYRLNFPGAGTYPIYLEVTQNLCKSDTVKDSVKVGTYPVSIAGSDTTICANSFFQLGSAPVAGLTYSWTPLNYLFGPTFANPQINIPDFGTSDTIAHYILATTNVFCTSRDTINIRVKPQQIAKFTPPGQQCQFESKFNFTPSSLLIPGSNFTWSFGAGATPDSAFVASPTGIHFTIPGWQKIKLISKSAGCPSTTFTDSVYIKPTPVVSIDANLFKGCPPLLVKISNLSANYPNSTLLYNLGNGDTTSVDNPTYTYTAAGTYYPTLTIVSQDTCSGTDTLATPIDVAAIPDPTFSATPDVTYNISPDVTFSYPHSLIHCYYDFGDGSIDSTCNIVHSYADTGTYVVTLIVINQDGCSDTSQQTVYVKAFYTLYIPNAFTPNGDLKNDNLTIQAYGVEEFHFSVFNRRGQMVFETTDPNATWNGKYLNSGADCPFGVYVYTASLKDSNKKRHNVTGRITIIR